MPKIIVVGSFDDVSIGFTFSFIVQVEIGTPTFLANSLECEAAAIRRACLADLLGIILLPVVIQMRVLTLISNAAAWSLCRSHRRRARSPQADYRLTEF